MVLNFKKLALIAVSAMLFSCSAVPVGNKVVSSSDVEKAVTRLTRAGVPLHQSGPHGHVSSDP